MVEIFLHRMSNGPSSMCGLTSFAYRLFHDDRIRRENILIFDSFDWLQWICVFQHTIRQYVQQNSLAV